MACNPPFAHGTGGWCGCNCKCCPPPCCNSVTIKFQCGTTAADWPPVPGPNDGCPCTMVAGFRARNAPKPVSMPEFNYEAITSEDGVFAFAVGGTCSVPCTTVTATLTTDSCCLEINGSTIYNVGSGVVTAVVSPLTASGSCGTVIPYVNGEANAAHVADGDPVVVTLQTEDVSCCPCCKVGTPQCAVHHASFSEAIQRRRRAIMKGKKKGVLVVDQDALKEHIQKRNVTSRRSRPTSEPPQASP